MPGSSTPALSRTVAETASALPTRLGRSGFGRCPVRVEVGHVQGWAHVLGSRSHFATKSRAYSTTLGALRDIRRARRLTQADAARASYPAPAPAPDTVLVTESSWADHVGSAGRTGDTWGIT
ncbi:replication initiator [Streptomyces erythrochromogenes]|uniref:replication initiator n=1 Tax=Streptomyces erythrochromogenes TaxID=285574 RepID=UPI00343211C9